MSSNPPSLKATIFVLFPSWGCLAPLPGLQGYHLGNAKLLAWPWFYNCRPKSSVMWLESQQRRRNWSCLLGTQHTGTGQKWETTGPLWSDCWASCTDLLGGLGTLSHSQAAVPGNPCASGTRRPWVSPTFSQPLAKYRASSPLHFPCLSGLTRPSSLLLTTAIQKKGFPSSSNIFYANETTGHGLLIWIDYLAESIPTPSLCSPSSWPLSGWDQSFSALSLFLLLFSPSLSLCVSHTHIFPHLFPYALSQPCGFP